MDKNYVHLVFLFLVPGFLFVQAQVNFLGKPGVMTTPSASWDDQKTLGFSFAYVPQEYSRQIFVTRNTSPLGNSLNIYNSRVGITSFMEIYLNIVYTPGLREVSGIGERHLDFRFKLFKEKKYLPDIVLGWTPPGSVAPVIAHDYLVATKNILTSAGNLILNVGYGSPFVFVKNRNSDSFFNQLTAVKKATNERVPYLSGFFGSFSYAPVNFAGVMVEYNTQSINFGAYIKLWDWLHLQGYTYEGKKMAFQFATNFSLNFSPYALKRFEKSLD